ncbi:nucleotide exchange factor GrpE [soil metagenome]
MKNKIKKEVNPEIELLKAQLARTLADYDNLVKRTEADKSNWIKFATQGFIQDLLPVLDTFENAQIHLKDAGMAIAINQFKEVLKNEGIEEIKPDVGDDFDENLHEVIDTVEDNEKTGKIAELLSSGWKFMDGMVIRHAKVKVFKAEI